MIRPTTILAILILAGSVFGLFQVKYHVQGLNKDLAEINRQLEEEQGVLHVLNAEWAYLNQPERLRNLVGRHLRLNAITISQLQDPREQNAIAVVVTTPKQPASPAAPTVKLASEEPKKPARIVKATKLANNEKSEQIVKPKSAKKEREVATLANNFPPLYPTMEPILSSLTVER